MQPTEADEDDEPRLPELEPSPDMEFSWIPEPDMASSFWMPQQVEVMGCEGPPVEASSSSLAPEVEEELEGPGGRSLVLDEGEEAGCATRLRAEWQVDDLAAEDCALPAAPEPQPCTATDLELDIFG